MKESWKDISEYEGLYMVSNMGRVKSTPVTKRERYLSTKIYNSRYINIVLFKDGKRKTCNVHRLVAKAFVSNPNDKPFVNHIDGKRDNNYASNLEWVTHIENVRHAQANGLVAKIHHKFDDETIEMIRMLDGILTSYELAALYGMAQSNVNYIVNYRWRK